MAVRRIPRRAVVAGVGSAVVVALGTLARPVMSGVFAVLALIGLVPAAAFLRAVAAEPPAI